MRHRQGYQRRHIAYAGFKRHSRANPPLIHRDIKPRNIIVGSAGGVTLIDFGAARIYDAGKSADTFCVGTQGFAPPEQYGFSQTTCRSDIYAAGVVLLWMAAGGTDVHVDLSKVKNRALRNVIRRMTAFSPENRFKSADEAAKALDRASKNRRFTLPLIAAAVVIVALAGAVFAMPPLRSAKAGITFSQEIIENAVRQTVGKSGNEEITNDDLLKVESLYIAQGKIAVNEDEFYAIPDMGELDQSLTNLEDLSLLPNLKDWTI